MTRNLLLCLLPLLFYFQSTLGQIRGDGDCYEEYGQCNRTTYEKIRLVALKSSGCKNFCQCAFASTELDGSVTYKWVKKLCPAGTLFDESLYAPVCNHENKVQCQKAESQSCEDEYGKCTLHEYDNVRLVPKRSSGCEKFCQCAHASTEIDGSVTYKWVEHSCADGLLFDANIKVCNYPEKVTCQGQSVDNTEEDKEIDQIGEIITSPAGVNDADCFAEYGTCNKTTYENIRLVALKSSGCENFCQCAHASTQTDGSVTYRWVKQTCPAGTLFDESLYTPVCNFENKVQCQKKESIDCEDEHGKCTRYEYNTVRLVPLRSSGCEKFCQCAHASTEIDGSVTYKWVEHTCADGLLFDADIKVCNYPEKVTCSSASTDNTEEEEEEKELEQIEEIVSSPAGDNDADCFAEYGTCDQNTYENIRLVALKSSGCKYFCQCAHASTQIDGSVTYKWVRKVCPPRTLFDMALPTPTCNHHYNVKCPSVDDTVDSCSAELGTCTKSEYEVTRLTTLPSSGCKKFCQCAHASTQIDGSVTYYWAREKTCPLNTLFDESISVCNWAGQVQC